MERQKDVDAAFRALEESFGPSARFDRISDFPEDLRDAYYGFRWFLDDALMAAGHRDPLLTKEMWIDSFLGLEVSRGSDHWLAKGWMICGWTANPGGHQWDVGFSAVFEDGAGSPRCQFRKATKYDSESLPFFTVRTEAP